jgi:hypothetical protein
MSRGTTVGDIRKAIADLDDGVRVFGHDEQADFMEEFIGFQTKLAPRDFGDGLLEAKNLIDPEDIDEIRAARVPLVEVLSVTLSR